MCQYQGIGLRTEFVLSFGPKLCLVVLSGTYIAGAAIAISSKSFNPKVFLSTVHPNATHQDLSSGTGHLRKVLESRSEAMRVLVEDNFDHFVAVKAATESM